MNNLIRKKSVFVFLIAIFTFFACDDDFLEKNPLNKVSPDTFFKKERDLQVYVNGFYRQLPVHSGYSGGTFDDDDNSDNQINGGYSSSSYNRRLAGELTVPGSGGGYNWGDVKDVNYFFARLSKEMRESDNDNVKQYIGEAYFFRSYIYYRLLRRFGDLPWIDTVLNPTIEETAKKRISRKLIVENMVKDLDKAIANMKDGTPGEYSRINKHVALAFKARVCLYEGTWEKYHAGTDFGVDGSDGTNFLELARDASNEIINSGIYSLYKGPSGNEYGSLFNKLDYSGNSEVILWGKRDLSKGLVHSINRYMPRGDGPQLTKQFVDDVLMKNGKKINESSGYGTDVGEWKPGKNGKADIIYNNNFKDRDPRLIQSVHAIGRYYQTDIPGDPNSLVLQSLNLQRGGRTGYPLYKGANPTWSETYDGQVGVMGNIIFRYGEVLLIYAEAQAELGNDAEAKAKIDLLRDRVGMTKLSAYTPPKDADDPAPSDLIAAVRRERRIELVAESQRLDDILRWAAAEKYIIGVKIKGIKYEGNPWLENRYTGQFKPVKNTNNDQANDPIEKIDFNSDDNKVYVDGNGFIEMYQDKLKNGFQFKKDRDYLLPINKRDITLSNEELVQNPGWPKN